MVDWAYVNGFGDDGGDPDHDIRDTEGHTNYTVPDEYLPRLANRRCKFCGSFEVHWRMLNGKWRLHDNGTSKLHQCRDAVNRTSEGFEDVA